MTTPNNTLTPTTGSTTEPDSNGPELHLPELCLVALVGVTGSGKSTFAERAFAPFEAVSSDHCRGLVCGDVNDQSATRDAFSVLGHIVGTRLAAGRLTVVDATNVTKQAREQVLSLAKEHDVLPVAIVIDPPTDVAIERTQTRNNRPFGAEVVHHHAAQLKKTLKSLKREGFRVVHHLTSVEDINTATIVRDKLLNDHRDEHGPFDIIGDIHGCCSELEALLATLGYELVRDDAGRAVDATHPDGRRALFVGDFVDRGPDSPGVLRLAMGMHKAGHALAVPGNHEVKLVRALDGKKPRLAHGLAETMDQLSRESDAFIAEVRDWCYNLVSHMVLDDGKLVVAHAGLKEAYHGRASGRVRSFALYGDTTGETDEYGFPVRYPWALDYRGDAAVVYGHTPTTHAEWINNTICLDTGCVFGGELTALRWPEREVVSVPAEREWYAPTKPLTPLDGSTAAAAAARDNSALRLDDVMGQRAVETVHAGHVKVSAEQAAGALEVMSRFALPPEALPYLPPTMSPVTSAAADGFLEHPVEACTYYAKVGAAQVIAEEKHMGSRAVLVLDADTPADGVAYTRTGRRFFNERLTRELCERATTAAEKAGLFSELGARRLVLDAEILPWSLKADELIRDQYAAAGAAGRMALPQAVQALEKALSSGANIGPLLASMQSRAQNVENYEAAYSRYVAPTTGLDGVNVAVFQVLASDKEIFETRSHMWHMEWADALVKADSDLFTTTKRLVVDPSASDGVEQLTTWWLDITGTGGEGMVVKPLANLTRGQKGLVQPGLKVRGREYLRMIYGPDYLLPQHLERLKDRNVASKRRLALKEYALGLESLRRWSAGEPTWRVHEPVFAVLAMESTPVDPRL